MQRTYVHENDLLDEINKAGEKYKQNSGKHKKGDMKNRKKYRIYKKFYDDYYVPMRNKIEKMTFDESDIESFSDCADVLNQYWDELKQFMKKNKISNKAKLHTDFLEEFSCYFFNGIDRLDDFDIFISDVFAGLKILPSHEIKQITKDVDFCIGNELVVSTESDEEMSLRIPAVSVEVKTYVDATMLGEIMNSARKIKGANPGSKVILLTWINSFADEHALEAAYDSSIDEIVVLSERKRKSGEEAVIEFTKEGLRDYYCVMRQSLDEVMHEEEIPSMGRLLSFVRHIGAR